MTITALAPKIDSALAARILAHCDYKLADISLTYGGITLEDGDISHQLYYESIDNAGSVIGYVRIENGIYFTHLNNYRTPQEAAIELLPRGEVERAIAKLNGVVEESDLPDYM